MTRYTREGWTQEHHGDVYARRLPGQALKVVIISREGLSTRETMDALARLGRKRAEVASLARIRGFPAATSTGRCDVTADDLQQIVDEAVWEYRCALKHRYVSGTAYAISPGRTALREGDRQ